MVKKMTGVERELKEDAKRIGKLIKDISAARSMAIKLHREGRWQEFADEVGFHPEMLVNLFYAAGSDLKKPTASRYFKTVIQNRPLEKPCNCAYQLEELTTEDSDDLND